MRVAVHDSAGAVLYVVESANPETINLNIPAGGGGLLIAQAFRVQEAEAQPFPNRTEMLRDPSVQIY